MSSSPLSQLSSDLEIPTSPPRTSSPRLSSPPSRSSPRPAAQVGLFRALTKARNAGDGPTYLQALTEINKVICALKNDEVQGNVLMQVPHRWSTNGIPEGLVHRIIEETYQRCVGPKINVLKQYQAFSSNVYGELTPAFVSNIIRLTGLHSECLFLDLGSGVGNVVLQCALQTGCRAYGIEQRRDTARIAGKQLEQVRLRARMWGVSMGEVELEEGDMTSSRKVDELMGKADVVLVNNYVFSEARESISLPIFHLFF